MASLRPSGMERMLESANGYFASSDVETLVVGQGDEHPYASVLEEAGLKVTSVSSLKTREGRREWRALLRCEQPDVVHIHPEAAWAATVLATRQALPSAPIVRTIHNVFDARGVWGVKRRGQAALVDRFVSFFVACSDDVRRNESRFGRNAEVVVNWIDDRFSEAREARSELHPRSGVTSSAVKVVIVGNCSSIKSHDLAVGHLHELGISLAHFGSERDIDALEAAQLSELESSGLLTARESGDPLSALVEADAFLMPSQHEGMGIALAEALAVGVPALVNDVPGLEWARGLAGVRMVRNDAEAWGAALAEVVDGSVSGVAGTETLPDFSARRGVREYHAIYGRALAQTRRNRGRFNRS